VLKIEVGGKDFLLKILYDIEKKTLIELSSDNISIHYKIPAIPETTRTSKEILRPIYLKPSKKISDELIALLKTHGAINPEKALTINSIVKLVEKHSDKYPSLTTMLREKGAAGLRQRLALLLAGPLRRKGLVGIIREDNTVKYYAKPLVKY